jgi:transcriptional regulator with XRE-family HTH domain
MTSRPSEAVCTAAPGLALSLLRRSKRYRLTVGEKAMLIGQRIRQLREQKGLSQGDLEAATGLLRGYISRVENGHTVPSLETLERFAAALDVPLYQLFYTAEGGPAAARKPEISRRGNQKGRFARLRRSLAEKDQLSDGANLTFGALAELFSKI